MPAFNPKQQAKEILQPRIRLGQHKPREKEERRGMIRSTTTTQAHRRRLVKLARWARANHRCRLLQITPAIAQAYLDERARQVTDKSLHLDRLCLEILPGIGRGGLTQPRSIVSQEQGHGDV